MRILILGAGAIGSYVGGRLLQAGKAEVAFLARGARRAQLERNGLSIDSPLGDFKTAVTVVSAEEAAPYWDVVVLTCKAYDLEEAIETIRPLVTDATVVLPLLNGFSHIDQLRRTFGTEHVLGGLAYISALLTSDGSVRQLTPMCRFAFGELDGHLSPRVLALEAAFEGAPIKAEAVEDVIGQMWEKLVGLGSLAAATVLMRANIGEIARAPGGIGWLGRLINSGVEIAKTSGHPVRLEFLEGFLRPAFLDEHSVLTASMLRDLEAGGRIEADHILGFMLGAARRAGVPHELYETAYVHAKAYENRRAQRGLSTPLMAVGKNIGS